MTNTLMKQTVAKSPAKTNYRHVTEIYSLYYGLWLMKTLKLIKVPTVSAIKGVDFNMGLFLLLWVGRYLVFLL